MPNCYYIVSSTPEQSSGDIAQCATRYGGVPKVIGRGRRIGHFLALVRYGTFREAEENLDKIRDCLVERGHTVHEHDVLEDAATDLGLSIEGYEPYEPGSTAE